MKLILKLNFSTETYSIEDLKPIWLVIDEFAVFVAVNFDDGVDTLSAKSSTDLQWLHNSDKFNLLRELYVTQFRVIYHNCCGDDKFLEDSQVVIFFHRLQKSRQFLWFLLFHILMFQFLHPCELCPRN